MVMGSPINLLG